jgi:hypothetical protein
MLVCKCAKLVAVSSCSGSERCHSEPVASVRGSADAESHAKEGRETNKNEVKRLCFQEFVACGLDSHHLRNRHVLVEFMQSRSRTHHVRWA